MTTVPSDATGALEELRLTAIAELLSEMLMNLDIADVDVVAVLLEVAEGLRAEGVAPLTFAHQLLGAGEARRHERILTIAQELIVRLSASTASTTDT